MVVKKEVTKEPSKEVIDAEVTEVNMPEYKTLFEALSAVQANIEQPKKTGHNPHLNNYYVTLDGIVKAIAESMRKTGAKIWWMQEPTEDNVMYTHIYGYGDHIAIRGSQLQVGGNKGVNNAQALGSALTYARRYSISMAFGIVSDEDDDGNGASHKNDDGQFNNGNYNQRSKNNYGKKQYEPQQQKQYKTPQERGVQQQSNNTFVHDINKAQQQVEQTKRDPRGDEYRKLRQELADKYGITIKEVDDAIKQEANKLPEYGTDQIAAYINTAKSMLNNQTIVEG